MKNKIMFALKILLIILVSVVTGATLLTLVYLIPAQNAKANLKESVNIFVQEGTYPRVTNACTSTLDNFTDTIMLSTAAYDGEENAFEKAMNGNRYTVSSDPVKSFVKYFADEEGDYPPSKAPYARYWQGYVVFLRPLLSIFYFGQIRILNIIVQTILTLSIAILMYKKDLAKYIVPYLLSICCIMPLAIGYSMQYSTVFYIFSIATLILICFADKWKDNKEIYSIFFTIVGICTSFFDFLTYPLATFGIPVVLYFCINDEKNFWKNFKTFIRYLICWGVGYAGMWAGKWILATLFTDANVITDAISTIGQRTGADKASLNYWWMGISKNFAAFTNTPVIAIVILFIFFKIMELIARGNKFDKSNFFFFLVISLLPLGWYVFASNHSNIHAWFTNKSLIIMAFALLCMFPKMINKKKKR